LSPATRLKYLYLAYFSAPKADRQLYRALSRGKIRKIVEMGMAEGRRSLRLIEVAQRFSAGEPIQFTGIDLFEGRPASEPGLSLKSAYKTFRQAGAKSRLLPGTPYDALHQFSNVLLGTDLLLIGADQDPASLAAAWFYVPRMLHAESLVLQEVVAGEKTQWQPISRLEVERLAAHCTLQRRRRAA
jgi:hypothetical protein